MFETVLNGLLPVAFAIAMGWMAGRIGLLKHEDAGVFAVFVIRFALPFSLFEGAAATVPEKLANPGLGFCLLFGLMGSYLIALAVGLFIFRHDLRTATMQGLVCGFPDMAFFGAPILAAMFGPPGFLAVLLGNLVTSLVMLPTDNRSHQSVGQERGRPRVERRRPRAGSQPCRSSDKSDCLAAASRRCAELCPCRASRTDFPVGEHDR